MGRKLLLPVDLLEEKKGSPSLLHSAPLAKQNGLSRNRRKRGGELEGGHGRGKVLAAEVLHAKLILRKGGRNGECFFSIQRRLRTVFVPSDRRSGKANGNSYTPFPAKQTVPRKLDARSTCSHTSTFHHVAPFLPIPTGRKRSQVMKGKQLIGPSKAELPPHCQLRPPALTKATGAPRRRLFIWAGTAHKSVRVSACLPACSAFGGFACMPPA